MQRFPGTTSRWCHGLSRRRTVRTPAESAREVTHAQTTAVAYAWTAVHAGGRHNGARRTSERAGRGGLGKSEHGRALRDHAHSVHKALGDRITFRCRAPFTATGTGFVPASLDRAPAPDHSPTNHEPVILTVGRIVDPRLRNIRSPLSYLQNEEKFSELPATVRILAQLSHSPSGDPVVVSTRKLLPAARIARRSSNRPDRGGSRRRPVDNSKRGAHFHRLRVVGSTPTNTAQL